jgi:hypothetical protein
MTLRALPCPVGYYEQLADRIRALRARPLRFLIVTPA